MSTAATKAPRAKRTPDDAELIRACEEHIANHAAANGYRGDLEVDDNPLWDAYFRTLDAVCDTPATTLEGLIAKAKAVRVEVTHPNGEIIPDDEPIMMWSIVQDLLRLDEEPV